MCNVSEKATGATCRPTCSYSAAIYIIVQTFTIILNIVAVILLSQLKGYRRNTFHLVVRVLVVSDAFGAASNLFPILLSCWGYEMMGSNTCQAFGFVSTVFLLWTVLIVLLMCTLRYFAVVRPLFYRTNVTYDRVRWTLLGLFIYSSIHILLPLFGVGRFKYYVRGQYCAFEIPPKTKKDFVLVHLIVWEGWLLIIVQICFTARMLRELRAKKRWTSRMSFQQRRGMQPVGSLQKGYTMMTVVIVAIFLVCYIPFLMYRALTLLRQRVDESYHFYLHLLAHINPMLNPILYVSCNRGYKSAVRSMLGKVCSCLAEPVRRVSTTNSINMSLFSYNSEEGTLSRIKRTRASTSTTFLEVPSTKAIINSTCPEEKAVKRRRGKRNSIDVTAIGSPTGGLKGEFLFTKSRSGSTIEEAYENQGVEEDDPRQGSHRTSSLSSSYTLSPSRNSSGLLDGRTQILETKPRGISISSIIYAADSSTLPRTVSPTSPDVIANEQPIMYIVSSDDNDDDDDIFVQTDKDKCEAKDS